MYDFDPRNDNPAIDRWVVQDPVIHFNYSPYSAFDNNPVYWADPSEADVTSLIDDIIKTLQEKVQPGLIMMMVLFQEVMENQLI